MTRARERLLLSGAVDFERWPEQRQGAPAISWLGAGAGRGAARARGRASSRCATCPVAGRAGAGVRCRLSAPASGRRGSARARTAADARRSRRR